MQTQTHAFELKIDAAASSPRRRTHSYVEEATELVSRFGAKSPQQNAALLQFEVDDA